MKKILFLLLATLVSNLSLAQIDYSNVLDLLINNKREDARKLFDKQFSKIKSSNIDLIFLDAMIDQEMGKIYFDDSFDKAIENLPNSQYYISPFINSGLVLNDIKDGNNNDFSYKKIDFLANSPKFKNLPIVIYRRAVYERLRYQKEKSLLSYKDLGAIEKWQFCGVFENLNGSGLEVEYEPENYPKDDKKFNANSNGTIGWYIPKRPQGEAYHFFGNESEYGSGIIYAQTFVESKETKDYILSFGANKGLKIFLNDKEIYVNQDVKRTNLDAYSIQIPLKKGFNRLLFKLEVSSGSDYFSAQIRNLDFTIAKDVNFFDTYQSYEPAKAEIQIQEIPLDYEKYFDGLVAANPENILYKLFQFKAYHSNYKKHKAYEAIEDLVKKYPNSSLITNYLIQYYEIAGEDAQKIKEALKVIETNDEYYYNNVLLKFLDQEWLAKSPIQDLEKFRDKSKLLKEDFYEKMFDFIIASRNGDINGMFTKFEELNASSHNNEKFISILAKLYSSLKNDKVKALKMLEDSYAKIDNYSISSALLTYYEELNRKDDVNRILEKRIKDFPYLNELRTDYIEVLLKESKYDQALELINENLDYFPYSFTNLEKKAEVYSQQKKFKEAEVYMRKSLTHNSANDNLRRQLYDITKTVDEIEEVETKKPYDYIKNKRKSTLKSDYGVVTLLDEYIVNILPEGGRKEKVNYIYLISSEKGIEQMKEYSLDLSATVLKSEIVKENGTIVPAEKGDDTLVFSNLKVGDVIYISYQYQNNSTGRFYRDFNISAIFSSSYPCLESSFTLIHPTDLKYNTQFSNGTIPSTTKKINNKTCTTWKRINIPAISLDEDYSPIFADLTNKMTVGTINSWKDISDWYADLVKKNLKIDNETKNAFKEIFPNGYKSFSEEERAKRIYSYIESNIKYSSLDFRQSGFIPQKPSKTITTKLGDCKDVSTLFVAFSELAELKSNLVLVLTNDNGQNSMLLPSSDFNHCIVRAIIDNKEVYLELTDKYLPFKALPNSLYNAKALIINLDKSKVEGNSLINIPFQNALKNIVKTSTSVNLDEKSKTFINKHTFEGSVKAYYNELFSESTTPEVRNKEIEDNLNKKLDKIVNLESVKLLENNNFDKGIVYETKFTVSESLQKVGSLKLTQIPFLEKIYTKDIINLDKRNFDIVYSKYEDSNSYESEIILQIPEGKSFSEIPQGKSLKFKNHDYSIVFELVNPKSLKVVRKAIVDWDNITPTDYLDFKKYVENIIELENQVVGFK